MAEGVDDRYVSPWNLGGLSVRELARRVYDELWADDVIDRAASLSFYFLFSLFPALLFVTALLGLLPFPNVLVRLLVYADQVLPPDSASLLRRTLDEIVAGSRPTLVSVGAITALWFASNGIASIINALNIAYGVEDPRPWWKRRLIALGLTAVLAVFAVTAMVLLVFGGAITQFLWNVVGLGQFAVNTWAILHWPVAVFCVLTGVALIYYLAPAVEHRRWYWVTPGSLFAVAAWIVMSLGLRFYVTNFTDYNATYGSIGGVILLMLWLYLSGLVLLIGAEINSEIEAAAAVRGARTAKARGERAPGDASTARPEPAGQGVGAPVDPVEERAAAHAARWGPAQPIHDPELAAAPGTRPPEAAEPLDVRRGARAVPWLVTWAAMRLVARSATALARTRGKPDEPRRAA